MFIVVGGCVPIIFSGVVSFSHPMRRSLRGGVFRSVVLCSFAQGSVARHRAYLSRVIRRLVLFIDDLD